MTADQLRQILDAPTSTAASGAAVRLALHQSLHLTFTSILVISLMTVVCLTLVPAAALARLQEKPAH